MRGENQQPTAVHLPATHSSWIFLGAVASEVAQVRVRVQLSLWSLASLRPVSGLVQKGLLLVITGPGRGGVTSLETSATGAPCWLGGGNVSFASKGSDGTSHRWCISRLLENEQDLTQQKNEGEAF